MQTVQAPRGRSVGLAAPWPLQAHSAQAAREALVEGLERAE